MTNPVIEKTRQAILAKADKRLHPVIAELVKSGTDVMYAKQNAELLQQQLGDGSDPEMIGAGVAKLIGLLFKESENKLPMEAMIPAAILLLCEGLGFLEEAGAQEVTPEFMATCAQATGSNVLQLFGATPEQIQGYVDKAGKSQPAAPPGGIVQGAA